ncbi:hypothetical protein ACFYNO_21140 [Kitasatospora sp. NPDC006697]|uniref:hypothetical protein n=1 Tax=Kitasatospora sp. NPDC006697 TaxID=3364020 RepID=UPI0036C1FD4A
MELFGPPVCPLHGAGTDPSLLVGVRLAQVIASQLVPADGDDEGPIDIWLIDEAGASTWITAGSDWCLIVETSSPGEGYALGAQGRVVVAPDCGTPFQRHLGERILSVEERWEPKTGRIGLLIEFESGGVLCDVWAGDLRILPRADQGLKAHQ